MKMESRLKLAWKVTLYFHISSRKARCGHILELQHIKQYHTPESPIRRVLSAACTFKKKRWNIDRKCAFVVCKGGKDKAGKNPPKGTYNPYNTHRGIDLEEAKCYNGGR